LLPGPVANSKEQFKCQNGWYEERMDKKDGIVDGLKVRMANMKTSAEEGLLFNSHIHILDCARQKISVKAISGEFHQTIHL
jgi:hypothetical protein